MGLGAFFAVCALVAWLSVLADFGLEHWLADERWDLVALRLVPLAVLGLIAGRALERRSRPFLASPAFFGGAFLLLLALELLALDGRAFGYLGVSLSPLVPREAESPTLLDTVAAMTLVGIGAYAAAVAASRSRSSLARRTSSLLLVIVPFLILEPLAYLDATGEYPEPWLWVYLILALGVACLSWRRQLRSFFYAGLANTGSALFLIADRYEWFDAPAWALAVIGAGLGALGAGALLEASSRRRRSIR